MKQTFITHFGKTISLHRNWTTYHTALKIYLDVSFQFDRVVFYGGKEEMEAKGEERE